MHDLFEALREHAASAGERAGISGSTDPDLAVVLASVRRWGPALTEHGSRGASLTLDDSTLDALDVVFAHAAWHHPVHRRLRSIVEEAPPLAVDLAAGQPWVLRRCRDRGDWWRVAPITIESLVRGAVDAFAALPMTAAVHDGVALGLAALELEGDVDAKRLAVTRWVKVVEVITDRATQCTLDELRQRTPDADDFQVGDEVGTDLEVETQALALLLLCALRRARPLTLGPPPDPTAEVEAAWAGELAAFGGSAAALARDLEARLRFPSDADDGHDLRVRLGGSAVRLARVVEAVDGPVTPRTDRCLASEVGVAPGAWVAFDRGPLDPTRLARRLEEVIVDRADDREGERLAEGTTLRSLLPVRPAVAVEVVRRIRGFAPLTEVTRATGAARRWDCQPVATRLERLTAPEQARVLLAAGELLFANDPGRVAALADLRAALQSGQDAVVAAEVVEGLIAAGELEAASLLMWVGELAAGRHGRAPFCQRWIDGPVAARSVAALLVTLDDAHLTALLGSS